MLMMLMNPDFLNIQQPHIKWDDLAEYDGKICDMPLYRTWWMDLKYWWHKRNGVDNIELVGNYTLMPNNFPYKLSPDIKHWLLFISPNVISSSVFRENAPEVVGLINGLGHSIAVEKFPESEIVVFVNKPELRSVKNIAHCHIFIR